MPRHVLSVALAFALFLTVIPRPATAQWIEQKTAGIPRNADGTPNLNAPAPRTADNQPDLSGLWRMESKTNPGTLLEKAAEADLRRAQEVAGAGGDENAQLISARAAVEKAELDLSRTRVLAPFDGSVVTGDLSQSLGAPVERGQVLFEVAPLADYRVVVQVDERDIADVAVGQRGELLLTAWPADSVPFTVETITPVSTARDGRNYFRVEAKLDWTPERLRPGMEGVGKILVGRRLVVWIWTRQAVDWVRLKLWAWWP